MTFFDRERLVYIVDQSKLVYYVIRSCTANLGPLITAHKVKSKFVPVAIAIFMQSPHGITSTHPRELNGIIREKWNPIKLFTETLSFEHIYKNE